MASMHSNNALERAVKHRGPRLAASGRGTAASGRPLNKSLDSIAMSTPEIEAERKNDGFRIFLVLFGAYLLIGAGFTAYERRWFIGFPPQLDIAYILLGGSAIGTYVEAAIACVLGLLC